MPFQCHWAAIAVLGTRDRSPSNMRQVFGRVLCESKGVTFVLQLHSLWWMEDCVSIFVPIFPYPEWLSWWQTHDHVVAHIVPDPHCKVKGMDIFALEGGMTFSVKFPALCVFCLIPDCVGPRYFSKVFFCTSKCVLPNLCFLHCICHCVFCTDETQQTLIKFLSMSHRWCVYPFHYLQPDNKTKHLLLVTHCLSFICPGLNLGFNLAKHSTFL